jgi:hypothetical protein
LFIQISLYALKVAANNAFARRTNKLEKSDAPGSNKRGLTALRATVGRSTLVSTALFIRITAMVRISDARLSFRPTETRCSLG